MHEKSTTKNRTQQHEDYFATKYRNSKRTQVANNRQIQLATKNCTPNERSMCTATDSLYRLVNVNRVHLFIDFRIMRTRWESDSDVELSLPRHQS